MAAPFYHGRPRQRYAAPAADPLASGRAIPGDEFGRALRTAPFVSVWPPSGYSTDPATWPPIGGALILEPGAAEPDDEAMALAADLAERAHSEGLGYALAAHDGGLRDRTKARLIRLLGARRAVRLHGQWGRA